MSISPEAQAYVAERAEHYRHNPAQPIVLDESNIDEYRREHGEGCQETCDRAAADHGSTSEVVKLNGVRTLKTATETTRDGALLHFFGGAFVAGGPDQSISTQAPLSAQVGAPSYGPFYPLLPEHTFPAALDVGVTAYAGLLESYSASEIAICGESAGGNLAITVTLKAIGDGLPPPACVVGLSPAADLEMSGHTGSLDLDPTMVPAERWDSVMIPYAGEAGPRHPLVSPIHAGFPPAFPPTLITSGTRDMLLSDCVRLHRKMRRAGVDASINVWDGMWHVFEHHYGVPEAAESLGEIAAFMRKHMDGSPA